MRVRRQLVDAGALVAATVALGGCTGDAGPWLFGSLALLLAAAGGLGVGWLLARQAAAAELHDARQQARQLRELSGGQIWRTDAQGRPQDGPTGAGGPMHDTAALLAQAADLPGLAERLRQPAATEPVVLTAPGLAKPCELRSLPCFDARGRFSGHLGLARPLAPHDLADAALAALASAWPAELTVLSRQGDTTPWRVLQASPAARSLFGAGPWLDPDALVAALPASLRTGWLEPATDGDGWHLRQLSAAGQELRVLWRDDGTDAAEQASFSYTVSHDLRAPIRVVEGFTRIVKEDYGPQLDRIANDHLDRVLGAAARMNQMIDAMLTLARLSSQPLTRQPVNLSQLAGYVMDDLKRATPGREVSVTIDAGMQTQGDPTLMRLVLENLLGNAWKYSARRAQTRIEFGREEIDGRSVYVVRDNGAGFDMRSVDRLFGLFQRLHSASDFAGTGVGLASVRRIIQRHGGEIWADGEPGRGAAFFFTLREG
jgi:signal transduction histidine kinase